MAVNNKILVNGTVQSGSHPERRGSTIGSETYCYVNTGDHDTNSLEFEKNSLQMAGDFTSRLDCVSSE